ncbi:PAS domain S-box protein [Nitratireductor kimnyeongensis]|uniref:histidine kinase n=1 Tax=Nitratireductor kimnyeongensis TaxID=430679 RepID=A0ABW0T7D4_9HYPH|nr:PAS domain S-box protein [Nitratireductor kimnyeongensis]QZZ34516.1 PAS domain S-box protein [Nitratireductor kimnyeongensis]
MASVSYSFVDIAVLDQVRERFAAGDALLILTTALDTVIWANGPGAALIGHGNIDEAIGAESGLSMTTRRQISATPGFPRISGERGVATRLGRGVRSPIVNLSASTIVLPGGEAAILLASKATSTRMREDSYRATAAVQGFDAADQFAALVDENGSIAAASNNFEALGIERDTLRTLVQEVREEKDRLVKRMVEGGGRRRPAAFARLTDDPAWHLLVVVDEQNAPLQQDEHPGPEAVLAAADTASSPTDRTLVEAPLTETPERVSDVDVPEAATDDPQVMKETPPARTAAHVTEECASSAPVERPRGTVRFAWRTDAEGRFTALSDAFAEAVGPAAADVMGRRFREVSNAFGLDPEGRISALLERRDTWSGRTVMWPIEGTDLKVPVDLAALPIYGRGRIFEGFHGFGLARMNDAVTDPEGIGLVLAPGGALPSRDETEFTATEPAAPEERLESQPHDVEDPATEPTQPPAGSDPAGSDAEVEIPATPQPSQETDGPPSEQVKIIRLAEHRTPLTSEGGLSPTEATAFREIGARLRQENHPEDEVGKRDTIANDTSSQVREQALESASDEPASAADSARSEDASPAEQEPEAAATDDRTDLPAMEADDPVPAPTASPAIVPSAFYSMPAGSDENSPGLLAGLPLPILIHAGDRLHYANKAFFDLTGYADLKALEESGGLDVLFPESYEASQAPADTQALTIRTAQGDEHDVHAHLQSVPWRDGKALLLALQPIENEMNGAAITAETGAADTQAEAVNDAELEAQTAELQMHLAEMRAIVDTATDGVVIIDNDGNVRSTNRPAEALFGFDAQDVTGKPFTALFAIESQGAVRAHLESLSDNGVASVLNDGLEVIGREAQGRFIPLFMTIGRLPHSSGFCAVLRDVTQWKRAAEELTQARAEAERASSQKTEFLARVSHEVRTPLNAIIGFSELMLDEKFGPIGNDRYRDYLQDINRSGNHVLDLVNDLLDISKIEAGEQEMHYEAVSLNDVLGETVAMMQPQANRERVIIRSSFASNLPDVVADPRSVRQIALNLLSNAVRYTPAGGQVIISTAYSADGSVIMRVRDTGIGMSPAEVEEALKPFKQINSLKRKRGDGTGLGLPLTRAMVEANRAAFAINSVPGEGTLVEVSFPPTRVLAD